ncbi:MAG TPA: lytic murein transglycosylase B [Burkholderiales bacterium]|nr:lytic murein transglycosylase B [Burkholderiales bacterium]
MKRLARHLLLAAALLSQEISAAQLLASYPQRKEVKQFMDEMVKRHGFARKDLNRIFRQAQFQPGIIKAMEQPAETALASWQAYRALFLSPQRIEAGVQFWNRNAEPLARAAGEFGVPEEIIVGIIGVETTYGRNVGTYRVIDALSTLAFDYPKRAQFFREELESYLMFTREAGIDPLRVKGSYAGAIGIPQFMPGSYRRFALDYDGDGHTNLASSPADAIGSIGNFLKAHGWARGEPVAIAAEVTGESWRKLVEAGVTPANRAADLPGFGVKPSVALPSDALCALIVLETPGQPSDFRVTLQNFFVLTRYNRSNLYATAVLDLGTAIARAKLTPPAAPAPPAPKRENP